MGEFPWKEAFQGGGIGAVALFLAWVLVKEIRGMRDSYFESTDKITAAVNVGTDKQTAALDKQTDAMNDLTDTLKYMHNLAPRGMNPRSGDTPTPGAMPAPGTRP